MSLLSTDIKLFEAQVMRDAADGGGRMVHVQVPDNQLNNVFDSIADLNLTYGNVSLRKIYVAVDTVNTDIFYGVHAFISDPPDDPLVSALLFNSGSWVDTKAQAVTTLTNSQSQVQDIGCTVESSTDLYVGATQIYVDHTVKRTTIDFAVGAYSIESCLEVIVRDENNSAIPKSLYTYNTATGVLTILSLAGVTASAYLAVEMFRSPTLKPEEEYYFGDTGSTEYFKITDESPLHYDEVSNINFLQSTFKYTLDAPLLYTHPYLGTPRYIFLVTGSVGVNTFLGVAPVAQAIDINDTVVTVDSISVDLLPPGARLLDYNTLGIDPNNLPGNGTVVIFNVNNVIVIHNTQTIPAATYTDAQTVNLGRVRTNSIIVRDSTSQVVGKSGHYNEDLEAGTLTFTALSGVSQPLTIEHRIEDSVLIDSITYSGGVYHLHVTRPLSHNFTLSGTYVSSALVINNLQAYTSQPFDQQTWTNVWSDTLIGSNVLSNYNNLAYPIQVTNKGALQERWLVLFTSSTTFNVIGETVGLVAQGDVNTDCQPLNSDAGVPYFFIDYRGWGGGWSAGNCLRFNTYAANYPIWVVRTVKQGIPTVTTDSTRLIVRGNAA